MLVCGNQCMECMDFKQRRFWVMLQTQEMLMQELHGEGVSSLRYCWVCCGRRHCPRAEGSGIRRWGDRSIRFRFHRRSFFDSLSARRLYSFERLIPNAAAALTLFPSNEVRTRRT